MIRQMRSWSPEGVKSGRLGPGRLGGRHRRRHQEGGQGLFHLLQVHLGIVAGAVGPVIDDAEDRQG